MKARHVLSAVIAFVILAVVAVAIVVRPKAGSTASDPPLPNPNGYAELLKAGRLLSGKPVPDSRRGSLEEIKPFVEQHGEVYALANTGLGRECRVPTEYSQTYVSNHLADLGGLKALANAMAARGRAEELQNQPAAAARAYADILRLGSRISAGGLMIDAMVGTAIESIAVMNLSGVYHQLDAATSRELIRTLLQADAAWEPAAQFLAREQRLAQGTLTGAFVSMFHADAMRQAEDKFIKRTEDRDRQRRHLLIAVAARAFQLETGSAPKQVGDLVPKYLPAAPLDPSGMPLDHPIP